jgi:hypothetical protein
MEVCTQRPHVGSRPWYGNFSLGLMIDNHPRFTNIIIALIFVEIVFSWERASAHGIIKFDKQE